MSSSRGFPRAAFHRDSLPLDSARTAYQWLVTGPHPMSVNGDLFPGLPDRRVALDELRELLLHRRCPQATRDAVWRHLVLRSRTEGATWTVACVGLALPALTTIVATLSARWADDPADIHSAVLTGFLAELARIDLRKPRVMLRLRWAAYRAGHTAVRDAVDAPRPSGDGFGSTEPARPWGHPDFVLARAVADGAITRDEAELISSTRLGQTPLADIAKQRGVSVKRVLNSRALAEHRLVDYLTRHATDAGGPGEGVVEDRAIDGVLLAGHPTRRSRPVTRPRKGARQKFAPRRGKTGPGRGVQGCGGLPAPTAPRSRPATGPDRAQAPTAEDPRCV